MALHSIPVAINYATPVALTLQFICTIIYNQYTVPDKQKLISRRRKLFLVASSCLVTASYVAQAVQYLPELSTAPDDGLIHAISLALLWTSLSLILLESSSPSSTVWVSTSALNLIFETVLSVYTFSRSEQSIGRSYDTSLRWSKISELATLALFTVSTLFLLRSDAEDCVEEETQSLLSSSSRRNGRASNSSTQYRALTQDENEEDDNKYSDTDSDFNSDSDDEEELLKRQKERVKEAGGWFAYFKAFKIFVPYVFPKGNVKLQAYLIVMLISILLQRVLHVLHPRQLGIITNKLWEHGQIPWKDILLWSFYAIAASQSVGLGALNEMLENRLAAWSRQELSYASLDHVMGLSMSFHDSKDSGEVVKAVEQAESLNELLRLLVTDLSPAVLDVAISLGYVTFLLDTYAAFVVFGMIIMFTYTTYKISSLATDARRITAQKERDESKLVYESVSNWFTVSCFNRTRHTMDRLSRVLRARATAGLWSDDLYTYLYFFQEGSEHLGQLAITFLAAHRIVTGRSTVGDLVAIESYWETITWPLYVLGHDYRRVNSTLVDAERLLQLFQEQPAVKDQYGAQPLPDGDGAITLDEVTFAYEGHDSVLHGLSLDVRPGETVAFVGETGSGKSTLFKLLMRFYDVTSGSIRVDGQDIRDVNLRSLRESFGFVPQDSVLFNMSILENVRYGRLNATDAEVWEACKAACIHDKILSLPKGYNSEVGERGVKLSGGERQRIAIARVLLKDARVVLLDEATSAMDSQTEAKIQQAVMELTKGRTTFVIAHRLSTVVEADQILVVSEGKIVERGRHAELLEKKERYYQLWSKQAGL